jgi:hypothetical protein
VNWRNSWELGLEERGHRVRYSAVGMGVGRSKDVREDDEPRTGGAAGHWHAFATAPVG